MGVNKRGFTLIELLLAVSIMALLIGVLLPALASAREAARQAACLANVNQLLLATLAYAADRRDRLPVGPATPSLLDPATSWDRFFCNWLWIGPTRQPTGHGVLMVEGYLIDRSAVVCPGADQPEVYAADLDALRQSTLDVFSAYAYRSYDQTTRARIDDLGFNGAGQPARLLYMDVNRYGPEGLLPSPATNHRERVTALGYADGHARLADNTAGHFTAKAEHYAAFPTSALARFRQLIVNGDWAASGAPADAPVLP